VTSPFLSRIAITAACLCLLGGLVTVAALEHRRRLRAGEPTPVLTADSARCYKCHEEKTPGLNEAWRHGRHAAVGVGCMGCHRANPADPGASNHEGQWIVSVPTPARCGTCHPQQLAEFRTSRHADAAACVTGVTEKLAGKADAVTALQRCRRCHGGPEAVDATGKPAPATWPGGGMGRVHLDGSRGNCAACHSRHEFSLATARSPETCGKCHGSDEHPQLAVYLASRHGARFQTMRDAAALAARPWTPGRINRVAPTCATCHLSATPSRAATHDVSARLAWQLRDFQLTRRPEFAQARAAMSEVCRACHSDRWFGTALSRIGDAATEHNRRMTEATAAGAPASATLAVEKVVAEQKLTGEPLYRALLDAAHAGRRDLHRTACAGPGAER
jgi:hydroxylamine dehydrogenase